MAGALVVTWDQFVSKTGSMHEHWIYRGGLDHWLPHRTSLERVREAWGISEDSAQDLESHLVRDFQRHAEARGCACDPDDYLGWFAFMQHHGAPSRLLDWTYSPFVAAYFALEAAFVDRQNKPASVARPTVWAIDMKWLNGELKETLPPDDWNLYDSQTTPTSFAGVFVKRRSPLKFIGAVTPLILNDRLSVQQGLFLCPGDVCAPWSANFASSIRPGRPAQECSFEFDPATLLETFERLLQMNMTARSLFPGLDGYARSMIHRARKLWRLPISGE